MVKKRAAIVEHVRVLTADKTREKYRVNESDFTRTRKLSFTLVVVLILRGHKHSLQNALNKVFGALGKIFVVPTDSAYCHARQKLKPRSPPSAGLSRHPLFNDAGKPLGQSPARR